MKILAISSASRGCRASMVQDGAALASVRLDAERGLPQAIPPALATLLDSGLPDLVAVVLGPGSFTGLRAGIAAALGIGLGAAVPVIGVTVAEALTESLPNLGGRELWVFSAARTGRLFLTRGGTTLSVPADNLPKPETRIAVAGDAANEAASSLAARGGEVMLTSARIAAPVQVAAVALRRAAGALPPLAAFPLYVDAPEAKLPAGGLRPPPA